MLYAEPLFNELSSSVQQDQSVCVNTTVVMKIKDIMYMRRNVCLYSLTIVVVYINGE